jgi:RimJ/RimL family protein N-acetyltransferase
MIAGRNMRLERLDPARHAASLHRANLADDRIWAFMPYGPFASAADYRFWAEGMAPRSDPLFYALCDPDGTALGVASYLRIVPEMGVIEIGHICFPPVLQRSIIATEALTAMIGWAFESGYRRLEWKCDAANMPSRRAAARLGLSYEGTFRQAAIVKGRNRDTAWFAAIDSDWPSLKVAYDTWLAPGNFDNEGRQRQSLSDLTRPSLVAHDPALG